MNNFEFYSPTRFVFGKGAEEKIGSLVKTNGGCKVLLHFGGGSVKRNGVYDRVVKSLEAAGLAYIPLGGVKPNPRSGLVREGIALCRKEGVDFVLAVGGGSVIDSAKAIAFGTLYDGDFTDRYVGKEVKCQPPMRRRWRMTELPVSVRGSSRLVCRRRLRNSVAIRKTFQPLRRTSASVRTNSAHFCRLLRRMWKRYWRARFKTLKYNRTLKFATGGMKV